MSSTDDTELRELSALRIGAAVRAEELAPAEVVEAHLRGVGELDKYNAVICPERALERARGGLKGPLAGVPVLIKDLFDTINLRTTYGSPICGEHIQSETRPPSTSSSEPGR